MIKENYGPEGLLWSSSEGFQEIFFENLCYAFGSPNTVRHPSPCLYSVNLAYSTTFGDYLLRYLFVYAGSKERVLTLINFPNLLPETLDNIHVASPKPVYFSKGYKQWRF